MNNRKEKQWVYLCLLRWLITTWEFFEELAFCTIPVRPQIWKRYVDDTCNIVKKGTTEALSDHLNGVKTSIKSPWKLRRIENSHFWPQFSGGRVTAAWKQQSTGNTPTWTSTWTSGPTISPMSWVWDVWSAAWGWGVTSTKNDLQKEGHHLSDVLRQNGYPVAFIHSSSQAPSQHVEDPQGSPIQDTAGDAAIYSRGLIKISGESAGGTAGWWFSDLGGHSAQHWP